MSSPRFWLEIVPIMGIGIISGFYIFNEPLRKYVVATSEQAASAEGSSKQALDMSQPLSQTTPATAGGSSGGGSSAAISSSSSGGSSNTATSNVASSSNGGGGDVVASKPTRGWFGSKNPAAPLSPGP